MKKIGLAFFMLLIVAGCASTGKNHGALIKSEPSITINATTEAIIQFLEREMGAYNYDVFSKDEHHVRFWKSAQPMGFEPYFSVGMLHTKFEAHVVYRFVEKNNSTTINASPKVLAKSLFEGETLITSQAAFIVYDWYEAQLNNLAINLATNKQQ